MLVLWLSSYSYSSLKDVWYVSVVGVGIVCFERLTFFVCGIKRREYGL